MKKPPKLDASTWPKDVGEWTDEQRKTWLTALALVIAEEANDRTGWRLGELFNACDHVAFYLNHDSRRN